MKQILQTMQQCSEYGFTTTSCDV